VGGERLDRVRSYVESGAGLGLIRAAGALEAVDVDARGVMQDIGEDAAGDPRPGDDDFQSYTSLLVKRIGMPAICTIRASETWQRLPLVLPVGAATES
jgi:hypothetical protein